MERTVKRVKVLTKDGKRAYIVLMDATTCETAKRLRVYATRDGYLYYDLNDLKDGKHISFARYITNTTDPELVVSFKDGNHLNYLPENLEVITKGQRGAKNLHGERRNVKVEDGIYYLTREQRFQVNVVLPDGKRRCPRAKTLEAARIWRDRIKDIHNIK